MKNSLGFKACIAILKWLRPRVLGSIAYLLIVFLLPAFIIQSFFVTEEKELWISKIIDWVEGKEKVRKG